MNKPTFRAWDKRHKVMRKVAVIEFNRITEEVSGIEYWVGAAGLEHVHGKNIILMQSTGLKDKNGVEIFEGDVVKQTAGEYSYIGAVEKDCYQFYIDGINPFDSYSFDDVADTSDCTADLTIIGNIHANPELAEVE